MAAEGPKLLVEMQDELRTCVAGEGVRCARSLDRPDEVGVRVRDVARRPDSFRLPLAGRRLYPDVVARLTGGRLFVAESKGATPAGAGDTTERTLVGRPWARTSGHLFLERIEQGLDRAARDARRWRPEPARP